MRKSQRIDLRVSPALKELVESLGKHSAAAEALLIIGASVIGADINGVQRDVTRLLEASLHPVILTQLQEIARNPLFFTHSGVQHPVQHDVVQDHPRRNESSVPALQALDADLSVGMFSLEFDV